MKRILLAVIAALISISTYANTGFKILPQPQKMEIGSKGVLSPSDIQYIISEDVAMPVLGDLLDGYPRRTTKGKGIKLILTQNNVPESAEGYTLRIDKSGVVISARTEAGLFYGCATLEQMLEDSRDLKMALPETYIEDYPSIDFRAAYFDTKHHLSRAEYYYDVIDRLSKSKINAIIWEVEDKLKYERRSEIAAPNALSKQEFQAISRYAKERNIIINPLVQGLGHAGFILKHHWELREDVKSDWEFCPSNPKTYEMQFDLYRDAMEAMPYCEYLHIGGDEITEIGICEKCKATGKSGFELQMEWLEKVVNFAIENGKTPIFWDDMPLKHGDIWGLLHRGYSDEKVAEYWSTEKLDKAVQLFPKNCIYMRWHYDDPTILANRRVLEWYDNNDMSVMAATAASPGETPFMARDDSRAKNIKNFSQLTLDNHLLGIIATSWDDGSAHWETVMRGYIAQGEFGWNPYGRSVEEFKEAHAQRVWGYTQGEELFLDKLEDFAWYFDGALVVDGRRNPAWQVKDYTLIDLPKSDAIGEWSEKYAEKVDSAKMAIRDYKELQVLMETADQNALRGRYTLEVYRENMELFATPAKIILALNEYDLATDKQTAIEGLESVIEEVQKVQESLNATFSKTRFMEQPNGYIEDMNHHNHLSALTLNSDWIFLYEKAIIKEIKINILD